MAKTFANIKAQARTYLDESSQADWKDDEVEREVNNGYQEVVTAVLEVYEDYYLSNTTIDLVENQQEYGTSDSVPSDIFKFRRVEVNYQAVSSTNSIFYKALALTIDDVRTRLNDATSGVYSETAPMYYTYGFDSNTKVGLLPVPPRDEASGVKIWYIPYVADLTGDTDTFNIPYADRYAALIGKYAAAVLLRKGQQEEGAASRLMQEFIADLARMKQQLEDHVADDGKHIIVTDPTNTDFQLDNTYL